MPAPGGVGYPNRPPYGDAGVPVTADRPNSGRYRGVAFRSRLIEIRIGLLVATETEKGRSGNSLDRYTLQECKY